MKIHILEVNLCFRFLGELERIKKYFWLNDHELVKEMENSDCVMLFGCAFNNYTEEESYKAFLLIRERLSHHQDLYLLEGIADTMGRTLIKHGEIEKRFVVPNRRYGELDPVFAKNIAYEEVSSANRIGQYSIGSWRSHKGELRKAESPEEEYQIKTGWGCNDCCTFCGDKVVVKNIRSKPLERCVQEACQGLKLGYRTIGLVGDDVGAWGIENGDSFITLLDAVLALGEDFKIRAYEINAKYLHRHLKDVERILSSQRFRDMVIAFQSGNNRILELMKREPDREGLIELIGTFNRYQVPVHSHVMVGFPSETETEFLDSVSLVEMTQLNSVSFFMYQDRKTAPAFKITPKVPEAEKLRRLKHVKMHFESLGYQVTERDDKVSVLKPQNNLVNA